MKTETDQCGYCGGFYRITASYTTEGVCPYHNSSGGFEYHGGEDQVI